VLRELLPHPVVRGRIRPGAEGTIFGGSKMEVLVLDRLLESLNELESSIAAAQRAVLKGGARPEIEARLKQYEAMLVRQRQIAVSLDELISQNEWEAVNRSVRLINGISSMLRDDAREVVAALSGSAMLRDIGSDLSC
jgi:hypothetical protein